MIKHFSATLWRIYFKKVFESTFLLAQKIGWDRRIAAFPPFFFLFLSLSGISWYPSLRPAVRKRMRRRGGDVLSICFWRRRRRMPRPTDLGAAMPLSPLPLDPPALKGRKRPSSSYKMGLGNFPNFYTHL